MKKRTKDPATFSSKIASKKGIWEKFELALIGPEGVKDEAARRVFNVIENCELGPASKPGLVEDFNEYFDFLGKKHWRNGGWVGKWRWARTVETQYLGMGLCFMDAIKNKDWIFFQRLSKSLREGTKRNTNKLYFDILDYCRRKKCGTDETPADPRLLRDYLKKNGRKFSVDHSNEIPRSLRETCKLLRVSLLKLPKGRPKKREPISR